MKPTLQNLSLPNVRLACALQGTPVHEIQDHAVGKFLAILVRRVRCAEVAEMESLDNSLLVVFRRAEDEVAQGVNFDPSSFPKLQQISIRLTFTFDKTYQSVWELDVQIANMHRRRWLA